MNPISWRKARDRAAALLLLGILSVTACSRPGGEPGMVPEKSRNVRVAVVRGTGQVVRQLVVSGPVTPLRGTDISAEEAGKVVTVVADKGARVGPGDPVILQDRELLEAAVQGAEADLDLARFNRDKLRRLRDAGKISAFEFLQAETEWKRADARLREARARYRRAAVSAPFRGVVTDRFVEPGQYALPGQKVARVSDPDTLKLTGYLTHGEISQVEVGQSCTVRLGEGDAPVPGVIDFLSPEADTRTGKFKTEILVPNRDGSLRAGVIGRATVSGSREHGVVIPRDAVLTTLADNAVFVVEGNRARRREVVLGSGQGLMVAVREGLAAGDTLVVSGQRTLRDGSLVRITAWAGADGGNGSAEGAGR